MNSNIWIADPSLTKEFIESQCQRKRAAFYHYARTFQETVVPHPFFQFL